MSLDQRVRNGLQASAETGRLDRDRAFDDVLAARNRRVARARVARQAGTAIVVVTIFAAVAVFISWRTTPDHNRSLTAAPTSSDALRAQLRALDARATELHRELLRVDHLLAKMDPVTYGSLPRTDSPGSPFPGAPPPKPPPVPEHGSVKELNLAFERIQLLSTLVDVGQQAEALHAQLAQPQVIPPAVTQTPATQDAQTPPATVPAIVALLIAVVLILIGAFVLYRRRTRAPAAR